MNHSTYGYAMEPPIANRSAPAPPTPRRHATLAEHPIVQQLQSSLPALALGAAAVGWLLLALEKRKNAHLKRQLRAALEAGRAARREARVARRMEFRVDVEEHEAPVEAQEETVKQAVEEMEAKAAHEEQELAAQEDQLRKLQEELHELKVDIQEDLAVRAADCNGEATPCSGTPVRAGGNGGGHPGRALELSTPSPKHPAPTAPSSKLAALQTHLSPLTLRAPPPRREASAPASGAATPTSGGDSPGACSLCSSIPDDVACWLTNDEFEEAEATPAASPGRADGFAILGFKGRFKGGGAASTCGTRTPELSPAASQPASPRASTPGGGSTADLWEAAVAGEASLTEEDWLLAAGPPAAAATVHVKEPARPLPKVPKLKLGGGGFGGGGSGAFSARGPSPLSARGAAHARPLTSRAKPSPLAAPPAVSSFRLAALTRAVVEPAAAEGGAADADAPSLLSRASSALLAATGESPTPRLLRPGELCLDLRPLTAGTEAPRRAVAGGAEDASRIPKPTPRVAPSPAPAE